MYVRVYVYIKNSYLISEIPWTKAYTKSYNIISIQIWYKYVNNYNFSYIKNILNTILIIFINQSFIYV